MIVINTNKDSRSESDIFNIVWRYTDAAEIDDISNIIENIRNEHKEGISVTLTVPYIPHHLTHEIYSKISLLNIDYIEEIPMSDIIQKSLDDIEGKDIDGGESYGGKTIICFSNVWTAVAYKNLPCMKGRTIIYFVDNEVCVFDDSHLRVDDEGIKDRIILMVECDAIGPSTKDEFIERARSLKSLNPYIIYGYATNVLPEIDDAINAVFEDGTVAELFTTNSVYRGENPYIFKIHEF